MAGKCAESGDAAEESACRPAVAFHRQVSDAFRSFIDGVDKAHADWDQALESKETWLRAQTRKVHIITHRAREIASLGESVRLNVGGLLYQTSRRTLLRVPGTVFDALLSDEFPIEKDEAGSIFIDRSGPAFEGVLQYLRTGQVVLPAGVSFEQLMLELEYYNVIARDGVFVAGGSVAESLGPSRAWFPRDGCSGRQAAMYHSALRTWLDMPPMQVPRSGAAACASNGRFCVVGGKALIDARLPAGEPSPQCPACSSLNHLRRLHDSAASEAERTEGSPPPPAPPRRLLRFRDPAAPEPPGLCSVCGEEMRRLTSPVARRDVEGIYETRHPNAVAFLSSCEALSPGTMEWQRLPNLQMGRCFAALACVGRDLFCIGGRGSNSASGVMRTVEVLRDGAAQWEFVPPLSQERSSVAAVVADEFVYVLGGASANRTNLPSVEVLHVPSLSWKVHPPMRGGRSAHTACLLDGSIYVAGGFMDVAVGEADDVTQSSGSSGGQDRASESVDRYIIAEQRWVEVAPMRTARIHAASAAVGGRMIVLGGESDDGRNLDSVESYDPATDAWTKLQPMAELSGRVCAASVPWI